MNGRTGNPGLLHSLGRLEASDGEGRLSLDRPGSHAPETWFLGPKGENADLLKSLVGLAIDANVQARRDYMPDDPALFDGEQRGDPRFAASSKLLRERLEEVLHYLRGSVPLSSHRNQSHMYWDQTLPGLVGYIAGLLYNQNNVAAEASPVTTLLEIEVGEDLCRMVGFPDPGPDGTGMPRPWGHITCDGSVANAESVWAARNAKYLPLAMVAAIREAPSLAPARDLTLHAPDGRRRRLLELGPWELLNLPLAEVLGLAARITRTTGVSPAAVDAALAAVSVQTLGLVEFHRRFLGDVPPPVAFAPATAHYSWPKAAALVGLGRNALRLIPVDLDGRMDPVALRRELDRCLAARQPVMQVVAVIGTTEESAVDPLDEILAIREEYRELGMEFAVHADAAWGGYFASMLRVPLPDAAETGKGAGPAAGTAGGAPEDFDTWDGLSAPGMHLSEYAVRQYRALARVDTLTVDPHKAGFIPYPAGALCYRDGAMRNLIAFTAPVVYHGGVDPTVGVYGIEGSKPGAAAAAVYLSHSLIRTDQSGYGKLLGRCVFNSKRFYAALVGLKGPCFTVTPFQRLPAEKAGATEADIAVQRDMIARRIVPPRNDGLVEALADDPELLELFRELGSDQTIVTYSFNFRSADGLNRDQARMNEMNDLIFGKLSLQRFNGGEVPSVPMFVTSSSFTPSAYGQEFVSTFARRAGLEPTEGAEVKFLISTTQNPWLTEIGDGGEVKVLMEVLGQTATWAAHEVMRRHGLAPAN
jgi:glutamate/tyrosine decarboxylase-like PLP-dependent enzyme